MGSMKSSFAFAACAAAAASLLAGPVLAGEITGNGKKEDFSQGASICKFSGQNDDPTGTQGQGPGGRVQSFGQDVKFGFIDPRDFNPGMACNPNIIDLKPE